MHMNIYSRINKCFYKTRLFIDEIMNFKTELTNFLNPSFSRVNGDGLHDLP